MRKGKWNIFYTPRIPWNCNGEFIHTNYEGKGCEEILLGKKSTTPFRSGTFAGRSFV
jgi:hypothetical protein